MEQVRIWFTQTACCGLRVRFTAGEAIDAGDGYGTPEGVLYYEGNLEELLQKYTEVYRYNEEGRGRYFYFSDEEALQEAVKCGFENNEDFIQIADIKPAVYKAVELPITEELFQGTRGVYTRMNLHPEIFGTRRSGKLYFPDKSCKDNLCPGPAVITEVIERTNFGFFKGYMRQYAAPTEKSIAGYIVSKCMYDRSVRFCNNKFGYFVLVDEICLVADKEGSAIVASIRPDAYDPNYNVTKTVSGADIVCQLYHGCPFKELVGKFGKFEFEGYKSSVSSKFISHLFDEAVNCGFISLKSMNNVDFVEIYREGLEEALNQFSADEMREISEKCAEINAKANEAIRAKIRSGKIRLEAKGGRRW